MKTLEEIRGTVTTEPEFLEERLLRKGAGLLYARAAKGHGDAASKSFAMSNAHLKRPNDKVDDQLANLASALREQNEGLIKLREMLGSITAIALVSVVLNEKGKR